MRNQKDALSLVALDIETTGLDPKVNELRAIAFSGQGATTTIVGEELAILAHAESIVRGLSPETVLVTWNGEEFDLPFLAARFEIRGTETSLRLTSRDSYGKYGGLQYQAVWAGREHIDIAPLYKDVAHAKSVKWSLKPVAKAELGVDPVEVDRSGASIAAMDRDLLRAYVSSDAEITYELAVRVLAHRVPA